MFFFDLDGTLLDSNGVWLDIDIAFLGQFGIDPVPADYTEYVIHHSFPEGAAYTRARYNLPLTETEIVDAWRTMALDAYTKTLPLKPGARAVLEGLAARGERAALLTTCMPNLCAAALKHHGLTDLLDPVLTTTQLGMEKRRSETYQHLARRFGLPVEACTLVDDSPVACAAAKQAGWRTIAVEDALFAEQTAQMAASFDFFLPSLLQFPWEIFGETR